MNAYVLHGVNDLRYEKIEKPVCPSGWAVIKVKAAGICSSDIPRIFVKGTYHFPTIPGHEFSGIVDSVADEENVKLLGKKVGVFPLIPCRECPQCEQGHYEMCLHYDYIGSRRDGAFAEYVAVPIWNIIELENNISFIEAAMMEPLAVALHAMKLCNINENPKVGIIGTGMIGIAAGQWALKLGATEVTIIGRSEEKRDLIESISGLKYAIQNSEDIGEFDSVLEAVGTSDSVSQAIKHTVAGGRLVLMGNPSGDIHIDQNIYWRILRKQLRICGTWNSSYENKDKSDWSEVAEALCNGEIQASKLVTNIYKQEELMKGLVLMREHKKPYCKVMTLWNEGED